MSSFACFLSKFRARVQPEGKVCAENTPFSCLHETCLESHSLDIPKQSRRQILISFIFLQFCIYLLKFCNLKVFFLFWEHIQDWWGRFFCCCFLLHLTFLMYHCSILNHNLIYLRVTKKHKFWMYNKIMIILGGIAIRSQNV